MNEHPADLHVAFGAPGKHPVEPAKELPQAGRVKVFWAASNRADRAGLSVNALKAEMITETAMVTANCW